MDYIKTLARAQDIREINRRTFRLNTFYEDYIEQFLQPEINTKTPYKKY